MRTLPFLLPLLILPFVAAGADFVLVDSGPAPPIIVSKGAPPRTHDAAVTLADYIGKIAEVRPAVIDGEPKPTPERAIWIGVQPVVKPDGGAIMDDYYERAFDRAAPEMKS